MNVPFQDTKYFKRNKIEILVSVCSRHHGTFKHYRRHDRLVLNQELIHIVDVVTVEGSSGGPRQVSRSIVFLRVGVEGRTNGDGSQFRATPDLISKGL